MTDPLPDGVRLLHIGPHKTGTTTLQAAFHQNRDALREQGVHYAGKNAQPMAAAMATATGRAVETSQPSVGLRKWDELLAEVRGTDARATVISSEFFSDAKPERVRATLDDLDPERTHVVVTLRPLIRILASQWQQYMQNRPAVRYDDSLGYDGWLHAVLDDPTSRAVTPSFWQRHRHDELIDRWASVAGPERLTVVVVDESDKSMLVRSFEELLSLRPGTLVPRSLSANRSLTYPEVRMLCAFNQSWLQQGWSVTDYSKLVRFGAVRHLQERTPPDDEPRLLTPTWAIDRGVEISAEMVDAIKATGVRVVGDLSSLADTSLALGVGDNDPDPAIAPEITARFMAGLVKMLAELPAVDAPEGRTVGDIEAAIRADKKRRRLELEDVPGGGLRAMAGRVRRRLRG